MLGVHSTHSEPERTPTTGGRLERFGTKCAMTQAECYLTSRCSVSKSENLLDVTTGSSGSRSEASSWGIARACTSYTTNGPAFDAASSPAAGCDWFDTKNDSCHARFQAREQLCTGVASTQLCSARPRSHNVRPQHSPTKRSCSWWEGDHSKNSCVTICCLNGSRGAWRAT